MLSSVILGLLMAAPNFTAGDGPEVTVLATVAKGETPLVSLVELSRGPRSVAGFPQVLLDETQMSALAAAGGVPRTLQTQMLSTSIQDPSNPDEPWVVTTIQKPGESKGAFIQRHRETVEAVREVLGG